MSFHASITSAGFCTPYLELSKINKYINNQTYAMTRKKRKEKTKSRKTNGPEGAQIIAL